VTASTVDTLDDRVAALFASDPAAMADPWPLFAELREAGPSHRHGTFVLITRYAECLRALRDPERLSSRTYLGSRADEALARMTPEQRDAYHAVSAFEARFMSRSDGGRHARIRRVVQRVFTPRRIAELRADVERYAEELLDGLGGGAVDLAPFAYQLPLMVIADMLEVPQSDRELIHGWSGTIGRSRRGVDPEALMPANEAIGAFGAYIRAMVAERRRAPRESDLVALLLDAEGDVLSEEELVSAYVNLLFAGHETTINLIASGLRELLLHRDQWDALCASPEHAGEAVEELLRFVSPVQWAWRVALADYEDGDIAVPAGTTAAILIAAANRDPSVFDRPDELEIGRGNAREHLAFGSGIHACLGAALARLEGEVAFRTLVRRYPEMQLAEESPAWRGNAMLRALSTLRVRTGTDAGA
jgi:cytochrome P450